VSPLSLACLEDIVQRCSVRDEVLVCYELIVLGFNDELRKKGICINDADGKIMTHDDYATGLWIKTKHCA